MNLEPLVPRDNQEEVIDMILRDKHHISRAEGGAGKTLVGVEAVLRSGVAVAAIVAPLNTHSGWRKTFERQSAGTVSPQVIDGKKQGKAAFEALASGVPGVYLIGWERFRMYDWLQFPLDFVILDEIHRQSNRKSSTHRAVLSTRKAEYLLGLSATPSGNKIEGLWTSIKWLWWDDKAVAPAFWPWVTKYLNSSLDQYAGKKIEGERQPGAIWESLPSKSYFPAPYQAEPIIHEIEVDLLPAQRKIYDRFEKEAVAWLDDRPLVSELPAVQLMRLRQICLATPSIRDVWVTRRKDEFGLECEPYEEMVEEIYFEEDAKSTKADAVLEVLTDLYAERPVPVLILTHSRKFATMLTLRLQAKGYDARRFVGGMSQTEREWKKENFGKTFDILVATIATVGEGTDGLQDVCHIEFWLSLEDNRLLNTQARWRLSRSGQTKTVQRYLFMAKNTVEQRQIGRLEADQAQLDQSFETEGIAA